MLQEMAAPNVHYKAASLLRGHSGKLLDLGCGAGAFIERLNNTYPGKFSITGSDFNKKDFKAQAKFIHGDLNHTPLPFKNNSFDVITLIEVIEHVYNPASLLFEAHRILKKNGILILTTPNVDNWQSKIHFMLHGRFFSFLKSDMPSKKAPGMGHINPLFDFQLSTLIKKKFRIKEVKYNRVRIPLIKHNIPSNTKFFGEIKIIKLEKV